MPREEAGKEMTAAGARRDDITEAFLRERAPSAGTACKVPQPKARSLADLFEYWSSLPAVNGVPDAADFKPTAIARWLPDATIIETRSPTVMPYRLAGTRVAERMGHDPTGVNMLDLVAENFRIQASRDVYEIVYRPCGLHLLYANTYSSGRVATIESLYMPLRPPAGSRPRVIAVHAPDETLEYKRPARLSSLAGTIREVIWIDIGAGTPTDDQPRP